MENIENLLQLENAIPEFVLKDSNNNNISSKDFKGSYLVLYFYPKDNTPGCTKQACDFKDYFFQFETLNAKIVGISKDTSESHKEFIEKYNLPFILLSDETGEVCERYNVLKEKVYFGKIYKGIERTTFLIDKNQKIKKIYRKVNVLNHIDEVLNWLKSRY